jgi:hypothetical protein
VTWTKIDDRLHAHPKIKRAWKSNRVSLGLHLLSLSYCGAYEPGGHVPLEFVCSQLPNAVQRRRAVGALIDAGLWEAEGTGWKIHDFMDCNPFGEQPAALRARSRARPLPHARTPAGARGPNPNPNPNPGGVQK